MAANWQDGGTWWRSPGWPAPAWVMGNGRYLSHAGYKVGEMLAPNVPPMEMRSPGPRGLGFISTTPTPQATNGSMSTMPGFYSASGGGPIITNLPSTGGGAPAAIPVPSQSSAPVVNPIFYDANNNIITSAICGAVYSMTVPGYEGKVLFIQQTKNGAAQFSGNMKIPMSNYASKCQQDEGVYGVSAYDPAGGGLIGSTTFTVLPAGTAATVPQSGTGTTGATTPTTTAPTTTAAMTTAPAVMPTTTSGISSLSGFDWILLLLLGAVMLTKR